MNDIQSIAKQRARSSRGSLGLSGSEPLDPTKILRMKKGISIVRKPLDSSISGCFLRGRKASVVLLNSKRTAGHQNFTVAHEFYHIEYEPALQGSVCKVEEIGSTRSDSEQMADEFAANFLVPAEAVEELMFRLRGSRNTAVGIAEVIELEQYFGISHQAMLRRLKNLGWLSARQVQSLQGGVTAWARRLGYDTSLYSISGVAEVLSPYARLAREAYERGKISWGKYRQLIAEGGLADLILAEEESPLENEDCKR